MELVDCIFAPRDPATVMLSMPFHFKDISQIMQFPGRLSECVMLRTYTLLNLMHHSIRYVDVGMCVF